MMGRLDSTCSAAPPWNWCATSLFMMMTMLKVRGVAAAWEALCSGTSLMHYCKQTLKSRHRIVGSRVEARRFQALLWVNTSTGFNVYSPCRRRCGARTRRSPPRCRAAAAARACGGRRRTSPAGTGGPHLPCCSPSRRVTLTPG
jgi:hypothetical protein